MAKGSNKFGTFGGVFVPSLLTILGVIMYLRLPRVVGDGGLLMTLGIILAAHVISVTTGLSISSIATDKKVGASGPYYIVSRSLGLPIGGTLGLALFVGLSFSVSLYIIGFSESFLPKLGFEGTLSEIRVCGSIWLFLVAGITILSTSLAIKAQYFILCFIVLSLLSIFFGSGVEVPATAHLNAPEGGASFAVLFGIFFPAVTGFTAGVNMSGDLKDPKRSLPVGTLAAIACGLAVYVGLAIFVAYRVPVDQLRGNTRILEDIALWAPMVTAGIWGATLSSAMGSILGAPRILQALAVDRVMPRFFAAGAGPSNEPRRALLLAFVIAWSGILIGELDIIARIVSIFFIATYGFLNLSCAIESWAGTDFRPSFKIPRMVSVIGGLTCVWIMLELDPAAMAGAVVLFALIFVVLKRRQLVLETGDAWQGVWFSMLRSNLVRLTRSVAAQGDFRPNVLSFSRHASPTRLHLRDFGAKLVRNGGVLTDFELCRTREAEQAREEAAAEDVAQQPVGVFHRLLPAVDPYVEMRSLVLYHGFSGLEPNTVLLSWPEHREHHDHLVELLGAVAERDLNALILAPSLTRELRASALRQVDVWWSPERGNFTFSLALVRNLLTGEPWQMAQVRFLLVNDQATRTDALRQAVQRLCREARIQATVKVLNNTLGDRDFEEWVRKESPEADLVVLSLPNEPGTCGEVLFHDLDELIGQLGHTLLVRPSSAFPTILGATTAPEIASRLSLVSTEEITEALPEVELPDLPELASEALRVSEGMGQATKELAERGIAPIFLKHQALVGQARELVQSRFDQLAKGVSAVGLRQRRSMARTQSAFLQGAGKLVGDFEREALAELRDGLEGQLERWSKRMTNLKEGAPAPVLTIWREEPEEAPEGDEAPEDDEGSRETRKVKVVVPLERLLSFYLEFRAPKVVNDALFVAARHAVQASIGMARALNASRVSLAAFAGQIRSGHLTPEQVLGERDKVLTALDELSRRLQVAQNETIDAFIEANRRTIKELGTDLGRGDLRKWIRQARRMPHSARSIIEGLPGQPERWQRNESLLWRRSELDMILGAFQERLAVVVERTKEVVQVELGGGVVSELAQLLSSLRTALERTREKGRIRFDLPASLGEGLDQRRIIDDIVRKTQAASSTLPDSYETLSEELFHVVEEDPFEDVAALVVPVRRRSEFLVQAELVGRLQEGLIEAATAETHALGVARDVLRLISFNLNDLEEADEDVDSFRGRMEPIITSGITRLEGELELVKVFVPRLSDQLDKQLELVVERSDAHALASTGDSAGSATTTSAHHQVISSVQQAVSRLHGRWRGALTGLFYRRSSGVVLARQLGGGLGAEEVLVERVLRLAESCMPRPEVIKDLPFYYQHPFLGRSRISNDFWVARQPELDEAALAVNRSRMGSRGALIVAGERGSGRSALCRAMANANFAKDRVYHLFPPPGGSTDPTVFTRALESALGASGEIQTLFAALPRGSALVFHDAELWWERSPEGQRTLELICRIIDEHSGSCFFILNLNIHALRFINRLTPLTDLALALIECLPLEARTLKEIVMLRHKSTGFSLRLGGRDEKSLGEWRLARLFGQHFDYSGGTVGVALQSWITHIRRVEGRTLEVVPPERPELEVLSELPTEWVALLVEIVLHQQVTFERLVRITEHQPFLLRHLVSTLARTHLIDIDKQGVIELNRYMAHLVRVHLIERGVLV